MAPMSFISELMSSSTSSSTSGGGASVSGGPSRAVRSNAIDSRLETSGDTEQPTFPLPMRMPGGVMGLRDPLTRMQTSASRSKNVDKMSGPEDDESDKDSAKLISIRELMARNAAKDRPALVLMDQPTENQSSSMKENSRQQVLSEMLGRRGETGGSGSATSSATTSPASSTTSSAATTPTTSAPTKKLSARNVLNDLLMRRQPAQAEQSESTKVTASKETSKKKRSENPALQALFAQRGGGSSSKQSSSESKDKAIADLLAKRGASQQPVETAEGDARKNALSQMLASRSGESQSPKKSTAKANPVADMMAKRAAANEVTPAKNNAVAEMLARRNPGPPPPASSDPKTNALSEMLSRRNGGTAKPSSPPPTPAKSNPLADMLAKRTQASKPQEGDARNNALAEMLAKRGAPKESPPTESKSSGNPLAAMLAKRQAAAAPPPSAGSTESTESTPAVAADEHANTPLKDHPKYASYFKMLKIGHPPDVVRHRMRREGADPAILDCDPLKPLPSQPSKDGELDDQDPEFQKELKLYNAKIPKYQQMLKMGLPRGAVEQKMQMEGVDVAWLESPPKPKKKATAGPTEAEIAAHREKYAQYFQMLKMGLPRGAVEHKMRMSGIDPRELDGPLVAGGNGENKPSKPPVPVVKKPSSIRKKLHWEVKRQETRDSRRDSLWNITLDEDSALSQVRISQESKEMLEKLFVKDVTTKSAVGAGSADPKKGGASKQPKKQVMYLIDMKKSQNIAITLARIKLSFPELKREILALNPTVLSTAQLQSLMDMWPDQQEQVAVDNFHGDESLIGAAEKFLVEVRNIPRFREKLGCLVFKQEFPNRVHELRESINLVIRGVNQVCCSSALQQLFIYILQTGNLLNFGTDDMNAVSVGGFSLNSLVKLSQTKAFTGGITFLQYIVQCIERDIPQLGRFPQQINLIQKCSKVSIASLFSEKRALEEGLKSLNHEAQAVVPAEGDADAELGASILKHFAAEVAREIEALESMLDQLMECKERFLEYFEEEGTSEELDVLLTHIANFTADFQREHTKHLEALEKKRLQDQQKQDQEAKKQKMQEKQQNSKAPRHPHHENPLHKHRQHHGVAVKLRPSSSRADKSSNQEEAKPQSERQPTEEAEEAQEAEGGKGGSTNYFPHFVVDNLKKKGSCSDKSTSGSVGGQSRVGSDQSRPRMVDSTTAA